MNILVVGSGGREHALGWALKKSDPRVSLLFAPGNAGTAGLGRNVPLQVEAVKDIVRLAREAAVSMVVVGPEVPLVRGLVDALEAEGIPAVGPSAAAARLEGSKAFSKSFMARYGIPTATFKSFHRADAAAARDYVAGQPEGPLVVKASGLAAGKGAVVCESRAHALETLDEMLDAAYGDAADEIVVEGFMEGEEASLFALTDGERYVLLAPAQDHKRIGEGDTGPNTGGMGAYAPAPAVTGAILTRACRTIIEPTLGGMMAEGHPFRGILYVGLMLTAEGPKVVEYNCRLGDPEAQAVLPLLQSSAVEVFSALAHRRLEGVRLFMHPGAAATVVLASEGYPGAYPKGHVITGLEDAESVPGALVFHAGTARNERGEVVTSGGRVLATTGVGATLESALQTAYAAADCIHFEGRTLRRDIGHRALRPATAGGAG